ncbi:MAG TPA: M23 family metallopeptidase [Chthoniobacterales bacterium]|jgi:murein DD-endopeptidase MepM/ murein hydrolase activator NlpD|nr:M23 family metallopeptidase [Chthoniobacterales bacterium]
MKRRLAFVVLLFASRLFGAEEDQTGFRVITENTADGGVTLIMKSDFCIEFTVSLDATLKNVTSSPALPLTVDAAGRRSFVLARFKTIDPTKAWSYNYTYSWQYGGRRKTTEHDADYAMPFGPGRYVVLQGPRGTYSHYAGSSSENAVDWDVPEGTIICAAREGRVVGVRDDSTISGTDPKFKPLGNYVIIKHADGTFADYHHLQTGGAMVKIGDDVTVGQPIGLSGATGFASKPHLHFMVFQAIDGKRLLSLPFRLKTSRGTFTELVKGREY